MASSAVLDQLFSTLIVTVFDVEVQAPFMVSQVSSGSCLIV
jgi:hypothetical protein